MTDIRGPAARACPGSTYEGVDAMGRGRQKAKQTKVARQLKYFSPDTDYNALQKELTGGSNGHSDDEPRADDAEVDVQRTGPIRRPAGYAEPHPVAGWTRSDDDTGVAAGRVVAERDWTFPELVDT